MCCWEWTPNQSCLCCFLEHTPMSCCGKALCSYLPLVRPLKSLFWVIFQWGCKHKQALSCMKCSFLPACEGENDAALAFKSAELADLLELWNTNLEPLSIKCWELACLYGFFPPHHTAAIYKHLSTSVAEQNVLKTVLFLFCFFVLPPHGPVGRKWIETTLNIQRHCSHERRERSFTEGQKRAELANKFTPE